MIEIFQRNVFECLEWSTLEFIFDSLLYSVGCTVSKLEKALQSKELKLEKAVGAKPRAEFGLICSFRSFAEFAQLTWIFASFTFVF